MSVVSLNTNVLCRTGAVFVVHAFGCRAIDGCFLAGIAVGTPAAVTGALLKAFAAGTGVGAAAAFRVDFYGALFAAAFLVVRTGVCAAGYFGHILHSFREYENSMPPAAQTMHGAVNFSTQARRFFYDSAARSLSKAFFSIRETYERDIFNFSATSR